MAIRVTVVSDSHLSDRNPDASRHWDSVVEHLAADPPDLVVWLEAELPPDSGPVILVLHKPVVPVPADRRPNPRRYVPEPARARLLRLLSAAADRPVVVSGHVHQYLQHERDGIAHVWAPATWATLPDRIQPPVGAKVIGVVALTLHDDGRHEVELQHPAGRREAMLGVDVDDPYGRTHP